MDGWMDGYMAYFKFLLYRNQSSSVLVGVPMDQLAMYDWAYPTPGPAAAAAA